MIIQKSFQITKSHDDLKQAIKQYWESRSIVFTEDSDTQLIGNRGNLTGNIFSYDMSQLITTLKVSIEETSTIHCEFTIDTRFQQITEWNHAYWQLELETFESVLEGNGHMPHEWQAYNHMVQKKNIMWSFKMTIVAVLIIAIFKFLVEFMK